VFQHPIPYVRQIALENAPNELSPALVALVRANLAHADDQVQIGAAQLASRAKLKALAPDIVKAMAGKSDLRLSALAAAAYQLDAKLDVARMLVTLLADKDAFHMALSWLVESLVHQGSTSSTSEVPEPIRKAIAARWKAFVEAHATEFAAGKRIPLEDPSVTPDLVPAGWQLGRGNGKYWP
jgi:hypothetical protein